MPESVFPVLPGIAEIDEVAWAKDQSEYNTLVAITFDSNPKVPVTSRWRFTDAERIAIFNGSDLYLTQLTFGNPLQPVCLQVMTEPEALWNLPRQNFAPAVSYPLPETSSLEVEGTE